MQETQEMWVWPLGWKDHLEKKVTTWSSIPVWKIPWTEEPGGLQSRGQKELDTTEWPRIQFSSVQFSRSVMSDSLWLHELQHARHPCPSPTPGVYSNSCPSSQWCHPAISSSVIPFSSCPQSLPASGSFPMSQLFTWGGQSFGVSALASVLPMNTQDWSPSGWCICQYQPPNSSHLFLPPRCPYIHSLHLCLYLCFANRFICTIFLDSTNMH